MNKTIRPNQFLPISIFLIFVSTIIHQTHLSDSIALTLFIIGLVIMFYGVGTSFNNPKES